MTARPVDESASSLGINTRLTLFLWQSTFVPAGLRTRTGAWHYWNETGRGLVAHPSFPKTCTQAVFLSAQKIASMHRTINMREICRQLPRPLVKNEELTEPNASSPVTIDHSCCYVFLQQRLVAGRLLYLWVPSCITGSHTQRLSLVAELRGDAGAYRPLSLSLFSVAVTAVSPLRYSAAVYPNVLYAALSFSFAAVRDSAVSCCLRFQAGCHRSMTP